MEILASVVLVLLLLAASRWGSVLPSRSSKVHEVDGIGVVRYLKSIKRR